MSELEVKTLFDGIQPASCYKWYDASFSACKTECKISHICKPATARRIKGLIPNPTPPPPPPPLPEPVPEPVPMDYLFEMVKGKGELKFNRKMSNDKCDVRELHNEDGKVCIRFRVVKDGSNRVMVESTKGKILRIFR